MSRVEQLPDDFDESLNLNKDNVKPDTTAEDASLDDLYDRAMQRGGFTDQTFEESLTTLSKTPLFMTDLADAGDDKEANEMLEAIRALQYEGTKSEIAQNFKEQGNECIAAKQWKDAREHYSKGLAILLLKDEGKYEQPQDMEDESRKRNLLKEQLYSNRARANLELKNYRSTTLDCGQAILLNPSNVKAHYRSATALFALDKVYEALDVCYRGLKIDTENTAMQALLEKIQKRSQVKQEQDRRRRAEQQRKQKEKMMLATALKARNITIKGSSKPPDMADAEIRLTPDPLSPKSTLEFPTMLLYPMHNQSDFIKAFGEKDGIIDHLGYILPLPWDGKGEYTLQNVECYMDTVTGGIMKVGKKLTLLEVLSGSKTEVLDGLVRIYVVPKALAPRWIEDIKKKKGK